RAGHAEGAEAVAGGLAGLRERVERRRIVGGTIIGLRLIFGWGLEAAETPCRRRDEEAETCQAHARDPRQLVAVVDLVGGAVGVERRADALGRRPLTSGESADVARV